LTLAALTNNHRAVCRRCCRRESECEQSLFESVSDSHSSKSELRSAHDVPTEINSLIKRLIIFGIAAVVLIATGCGKAKPGAAFCSQPTWWCNLSLSQREYVAELYRVCITAAVWQNEFSRTLRSAFRTDSLSPLPDSTRIRVFELRRVAADRARLAMRLTDVEQAKWLQRFLSLFLESGPPVGSASALLKWCDSLAGIPLEAVPGGGYIILVPGRLVALHPAPAAPQITFWEEFAAPNATVNDHTGGFVDSVLPEPKEERTPMGRLEHAYWLAPLRMTPEQQHRRWYAMVATEFDDPRWRLGWFSTDSNRTSQ